MAVGDFPATVRATNRRKTRFVVKRVKLTFGVNGRTGEPSATKQILQGRPGMIRGISMDFSASANASGVVTIKENTSSGATLFTSTTGTDTTTASTGTLLVPCTDGLNVSNSTVADIPGLFFGRGLFLSYASATAGDSVVVRLVIDTQIVYHRAVIALSGADGSAAGNDNFFFGRAGVLRAIRMNASAGSTADLTIKVDADDQSVNSGATVFTATNYGTSAIGSAAGTGCPAAVTVGGLDEANGAVTAPGEGIPFLHGLKATIAQANKADVPVIEYWIEA
jgi:hypothetical protein